MSQVTKRALGDALRHFLTQKPLNKITITDLTEYCGVSRMTFYYHFEDIYALVVWCCEESARKALENVFEQWQEGFYNIFQVVLEDRVFVLNVYRTVGREQVERYLVPYLHRLIQGVLEKKYGDFHVMESDKEFIIACYEHVLVGAMMDWIQAGMQEDPAAIVRRMDTFLRGSVPVALRNFSDTPSEKTT